MPKKHSQIVKHKLPFNSIHRLAILTHCRMS